MKKVHRSFLSRPQEDVLAPLEESVEIRRKLAELNPAAHRVDLANSLAVASASYLSFGRVSDATAAAQESVALSRETGRSDAASQAILALSLWALAQAQAAGAGPTRAVQEALDCAREAAQIYQQLSNGDDPYADHLASVLSMTACALLIKLNRADEARQIQGLVGSGAIKEAIAILR